MKFHELVGNKPKNRKRVGRGVGSGTGKTAGRGTKGQKARTGHHYVPADFEGGQMKLTMRLPKKKGFRHPTRRNASVQLSRLNALPEGTEVTLKLLKEKGFIDKHATAVKIVAGGELKKKLVIKVPKTPGVKAEPASVAKAE